MRKFYTLKYDAVFKNIFLKDEELLKTFLTNIMSLFYDDFKIDYLEVKNGELTKNRLYIKNKIVDILVKTDNKIINLEVNTNYDETTKNRNLCYLLNSVVEGVHKDGTYQFDSDYIQLNFNFLGKDKKGLESYHFNEDNSKKLLTKSIRMININVDYYYSKWYNEVNKQQFFEKYKDIIIMNFSLDDFSKIKDSDIYMDKIKKDIELLNKDDEFYQWMSDEEDQMRIYKSRYLEATKQGELQGKTETKQEIAKEMLSKDMDINLISELTKLSKEEIEQLKNS